MEPRIVRSKSLLRRLPVALDISQAFKLDAFRLTSEMIDVAYQRLVAHLLDVSTRAYADEPLTSSATPEALLYAWGIVDAAERIRLLLGGLRGLRKNQPQTALTLRVLAECEELRHSLQHLDKDLSNPAARDGVCLFGTLAWTYQPGDEPSPLTQFMLVAGQARTVTGDPVRSFAGRAFRAPLDLVELSAFGNNVSLTKVVDRLETFVHGLEPQLEEQFEGLPLSASDVLLRLDFEQSEESPPE